jgi:hypothetical protein
MAAATNKRANLTTNVIASVAKQSRAFAKTLMFFLDCFVAALLAMTRHLLPLHDFSRLRFPHFQFSILNFQLLKNEVMRLLGVCYLRATEVVLSGKSGRNEVLFPMNKVSSLRDLMPLHFFHSQFITHNL